MSRAGVEKLLRYGVRCRISLGHPVFRTEYGDEKFRDWVLAVCMGASDRVHAKGIEVDPEIVEELRRTRGDWKYLVNKYPDLYERIVVEELVKKGVPEDVAREIARKRLI